MNHLKEGDNNCHPFYLETTILKEKWKVENNEDFVFSTKIHYSKKQHFTFFSKFPPQAKIKNNKSARLKYPIQPGLRQFVSDKHD